MTNFSGIDQLTAVERALEDNPGQISFGADCCPHFFCSVRPYAILTLGEDLRQTITSCGHYSWAPWYAFRIARYGRHLYHKASALAIQHAILMQAVKNVKVD